MCALTRVRAGAAPAVACAVVPLRAGAAARASQALRMRARGLAGNSARPPSPAPPTRPACPPTPRGADLYTKPALAKVNVCSRSVAVSRNGGGAASSSTKSAFSISKLASTACAEAVSDGMKAVCAGLDPVATISTMASTCASVVAEMQARARARAAWRSVAQRGAAARRRRAACPPRTRGWSRAFVDSGRRRPGVRAPPRRTTRPPSLSPRAAPQASSISGAEVKAATYPPQEWTKSAYTTACTSGCANGQVSAEAVAQAAACAFSAQTKGCNSVKSTLSGQAYSTAFVSTSARAWSNACALGFGKAHGEGEAVAKTLVSVLSRAFGDVVAKACSECDSCRCSRLPAGITYDNLKGASDTSAAAADGRFTMARAISKAAATYCSSDRKPRSMQAAVDTTIHTLATMIADVFAKTTGSASASGTALACSGGSVSTKIQARARARLRPAHARDPRAARTARPRTTRARPPPDLAHPRSHGRARQASKNAIITAVADANSVVFSQRCASAYAKLDGMVNLLQARAHARTRAHARPPPPAAAQLGPAGFGGFAGAEHGPTRPPNRPAAPLTPPLETPSPRGAAGLARRHV